MDSSALRTGKVRLYRRWKVLIIGDKTVIILLGKGRGLNYNIARARLYKRRHITSYLREK